jgi:DNA-binding NarL/FixJ family response regulator
MRLPKSNPTGHPLPRMSARHDTIPIKVALVEDDDELRANLAGYLQRFPDCQVVAELADGETALAKLPRLKPEVVVMDINLPGMDGIECVRRLKDSLPGTLFMMLTVYEDNDRLFHSLLAGASGYLLKRATPAEIVEAIRDLHAGGSPMTPQIARRIVQHYQQGRPGVPPSEDLGGLSPHQRAFLDQLAKGYRYKEIADNLGISMEGVRSYVRRIYEKLHVHSRTEAVVKYLGR